MSIVLKQSTSRDLQFYAQDASGIAVTGKVNGDWTKRISKNGAAYGAMTVTITEMENGHYSYTADTGHTDTLGLLALTFKATGVIQVNQYFPVEVERPGNVAAIGANVITAASLATDAGAELADAIWDEALSGHTTAGSAGKQLQDIATGSAPTAAAIADAVWDEARSGHVAGGSFGEGVVVNSLAADSITSTVIANDALDASEIAADIATELNTNMATSAQVAAVTTAISALLPASLDGGFIRAQVKGIDANMLTAAATASDFGAEIADAVWDEATSGHATAGTTGLALATAGAAPTPPSAAVVADAVWDEARSGHVTSGSFGEGVVVNSLGADSLTAASIAPSFGTEIAAAIMLYAHESGRTLRGLFRELEAFLTGKATGLRGTTAAFYRPDNVTKAIEAVQDPTAGTRTKATTNGDSSV
jgi:hypothetical protein